MNSHIGSMRIIITRTSALIWNLIAVILNPNVWPDLEQLLQNGDLVHRKALMININKPFCRCINHDSITHNSITCDFCNCFWIELKIRFLLEDIFFR